MSGLGLHDLDHSGGAVVTADEPAAIPRHPLSPGLPQGSLLAWGPMGF